MTLLYKNGAKQRVNVAAPNRNACDCAVAANNISPRPITIKRNLTGNKYGRLFVISFACRRRGRTMFVCACSCGSIVEVQSGHLVSGDTKSCGCLKLELVRSRPITHKLSRTRLYYIWSHMKGRCLRKKDVGWKDYGGRGISICAEWIDSFESFRDWAFSRGYSSTLTIDRIDNNGNYTPDNCRWVTPTINARNKRNNRIIEYQGRRQPISAWAGELGMTESIIRHRISRGYDPVSALLYGPKRISPKSPHIHPSLRNKR